MHPIAKIIQLFGFLCFDYDVLDEGDSINVPYTLNMISMFYITVNIWNLITCRSLMHAYSNQNYSDREIQNAIIKYN